MYFTFLGPITSIVRVCGLGGRVWIGWPCVCVGGWLVGYFGNKADLKSIGLGFSCGNYSFHILRLLLDIRLTGGPGVWLMCGKLFPTSAISSIVGPLISPYREQFN